MLTREQTIRELCSIMGLAQKSIGDFEHPNDGVCDLCRGQASVEFENSGKSIEYVRAAVVDALHRDGHTIGKGYDPVTGKDGTSATKEKLMKFADIKFESVPDLVGSRAVVAFKNGYALSIIRNSFSYGGSTGLYETALLKVDPSRSENEWPITYNAKLGYSDVCGWLSEADVEKELTKIGNAPPFNKADNRESFSMEEDYFPEPDIVENGMTREQAEREYQRGKAEGELYSAERKIYGDALAEEFTKQDEMNRYNAGDDN